MPKIGMEPLRRAALVEATIQEIGAAGSLDVTVSKIAKRAGMSSALAHHYFGGKDQIFLAAMRQTLTDYGTEVRAALATAHTPHARVEAVIRASFTSTNFRKEVIAAWLNFYVLAQTSAGAKRLLHIYQRRLHSNLCCGLRPLVGDRADAVAGMLAALIDGIYLRRGLQDNSGLQGSAADEVLAVLTRELEAI